MENKLLGFPTGGCSKIAFVNVNVITMRNEKVLEANPLEDIKIAAKSSA